MKQKFLSVLIGLVATMPLAGGAQAQGNFFSDIIDDLLDNYITLGVGVETFPQTSGTPWTGKFGFDLTLEDPDVTNKTFAKTLSQNGGIGFDVATSDFVDAGIKVGMNGTPDLSKGIFVGGVNNNEGFWGLTPTLGGQVWLGDDTVGVLLESDYGFWGPLRGWQGSATAAYSLFDSGEEQTTGLRKINLGATVSMIDELYATSAYPPKVSSTSGATGSSTTTSTTTTTSSSSHDFGVESFGLSGTAIFDLSPNVRVSLPIGVRHYVHEAVGNAASKKDGVQNQTEVTFGLTAGFRF